jgi:hypothetical protein
MRFMRFESLTFALRFVAMVVLPSSVAPLYTTSVIYGGKVYPWGVAVA